jgi:hypothetical protein
VSMELCANHEMIHASVQSMLALCMFYHVQYDSFVFFIDVLSYLK